MTKIKMLTTEEVRQRLRYRTADGTIALLRREGISTIFIGCRLFWPEIEVDHLIERKIRYALDGAIDSSGSLARNSQVLKK